MAKVEQRDRLVPGLLDRLIDQAPGTRDPVQREGQVLRELKHSLRRDLQNLLNTRVRSLPLPPEMPELKKSLVGYGLPDITGMTFVAPEEQQYLTERIAEVIRTFEPRLKDVEVELMRTSENADRVVEFRIRAMLDVEPVREPVAFESAIERQSGMVEVKAETQ